MFKNVLRTFEEEILKILRTFSLSQSQRIRQSYKKEYNCARFTAGGKTTNSDPTLAEITGLT